MKNNTNYFFVNRALLHSDRWLSEPFTRGQAWVDMFGLAQHTKGFFRVRGIQVDVDRGQLGYSQVTLAKRWRWSRNKVRRYLKELENNGDITLETKQQNIDITTIITIIKYDLWQGGGTPNETPEGHQKDTKRNTYNNDKNEKNERESTPTFFSKDTYYGDLIKEFVSFGIKEDKVKLEFAKFVDYWTEPNQRGRQRWQLQKTFEVKRRLKTWFSRINKF